MSRVLILFAHPALEKSRVNRRLIEAVGDITNVTIRDLYEEYPDFVVDVPREQTLLLEHDVLVLQHPFFWYSVPALVKEWFDLVLQHGWAYGSKGTMLHGKRALSVITTGARDTAYQRGGHNNYTMDEFLLPVEGTFRLCGVEYLPPFIVHGTLGIRPEEMAAQADTYKRLIEALSRDTLDLEAYRADPYRDWRLDELLPGGREGL